MQFIRLGDGQTTVKDVWITCDAFVVANPLILRNCLRNLKKNVKKFGFCALAGALFYA